jgi:hypothetical protein
MLHCSVLNIISLIIEPHSLYFILPAAFEDKTSNRARIFVSVSDPDPELDPDPESDPDLHLMAAQIRSRNHCRIDADPNTALHLKEQFSTKGTVLLKFTLTQDFHG